MKNKLPIGPIVCFFSVLGLGFFNEQCEAVELQSPNGEIKLSFDVKKNAPTYSVSYRDQPLVRESRLGFQLEDGTQLGQQVELVNSVTNSHDSVWEPVYGEKSSYRDHYNELSVQLRSTGDFDGDLTMLFRCYDEGVAFRYLVGKSKSHRTLTIKAEKTEFCFTGDHQAWCTTKAQGEYERRSISQLGEQVDRPLTIEAGKKAYVAIAEASLQGYARMKLRSSAEDFRSVISQLSSSVKSTLPMKTPWRVLMIADSPGGLLENNGIILNLNEPCAIKDTSWIKPGKVLREVTLTTAGGKAAIDFAVKHNFSHIEFDAGWYGNEYDEKSDATTITLDPKRSEGPFDLHECIRYGKEHGIGIIVYVNRRCLERQLDEILPLYKKWGLKGVKYGFVNVGSQKWTAWLHNAIRKAADHQLMVDVHDNYRSMGFARTYPNLMTQEGVRGDEEFPGGGQTLVSLFTRYLAGSADFTPCYYNPRVYAITSHAHQLAKPVCLYSPWQFLFWYDSPLKSKRVRLYQYYKDAKQKKAKLHARSYGVAKDYIHESPELEFWDAMPTVWDDTKVLAGEIGKHAVVARRSGKEWFLGAMNSESKDPKKITKLTIPCDFLDVDTKYEAHIYSDDPNVDSFSHVRIDRFLIDRSIKLEIAMFSKGGQAIRIVPATDQSKFPRYSTANK